MGKPKGGKRYEKSWREILDLVDREIAAGHQHGPQILSRIWSEIAAKNLSSERLRAYYAQAGIQIEEDSLPRERVVVHDGAYEIVPFEHACHESVTSMLLDHIVRHREQIDCIVELGSGTARNLFSLFEAAGPELGASLEMHACEFTTAGRELTERLRKLTPGIDLSVHAFDYFKPDLSFLKDRPNVLFFTVFSVEQIPVLGRRVIDEMLQRSGSCWCFHFEPVGWQFDQQLCDWRQRMDSPSRKRLSSVSRKLARAADSVFKTRLRDSSSGISLQREDIGRPDRVSSNAAKMSARMDYNTNLVSLLHELDREAVIGIEREEVNANGDNPFNPASIIVWRSRTESV